MLTTFLRVFLGRRIMPYSFTNSRHIAYTPTTGKLGMYIHVPFCRSICHFCPYNKVVYDAALAKAYTGALIHEL